MQEVVRSLSWRRGKERSRRNIPRLFLLMHMLVLPSSTPYLMSTARWWWTELSWPSRVPCRVTVYASALTYRLAQWPSALYPNLTQSGCLNEIHGFDYISNLVINYKIEKILPTYVCDGIFPTSTQPLQGAGACCCLNKMRTTRPPNLLSLQLQSKPAIAAAAGILWPAQRTNALDAMPHLPSSKGSAAQTGLKAKIGR